MPTKSSESTFPIWDSPPSASFWKDKSVLITGGTGSFGKKCAQILSAEYPIRRIIIFSRDELKQHEMQIAGIPGDKGRFFIGDVRDKERLKRAMAGVDVVIHAAALKHVSACEYNPIEAILTNVMGAMNVIDAAIDSGVKQVLALSTDKAVSPTNLYGATKLSAEKLFVQSNAYCGGSGTRLACVRYGNVLASRGSVIPLFMEQRASGKLTVTDKRMTRFWMSQEQSARFVLQCIEHLEGGEVFVPKLPSMKISELAKILAPDCVIEEVGIRPGEKLHEVLISEHESHNAVEFKDRYVILPEASKREGKKLPEGFSYASNTNPFELDVATLTAVLESSFPKAPAPQESKKSFSKPSTKPLEELSAQ